MLINIVCSLRRWHMFFFANSQALTSTFGNQQCGSRFMPYASTQEIESSTDTPRKLQYIYATRINVMKRLSGKTSSEKIKVHITKSICLS
ncbi:hypothetical protein Bca101_007542 [Brassica carinata]